MPIGYLKTPVMGGTVVLNLMKMKNYTVLLMVFWIVACSNDDGPQIQKTGLNGSWTLTNVICFCGFPDPPGFEQTQLSFDLANGQLRVDRNGTGLEYFRAEGTYTFIGTDTTITLEDGSAYTYAIEGNVLRLDFVDEPQIADDEITFLLNRN